MSGYEEEHNISTTQIAHPPHPPRRPDLATFFSTLELVTTPENNPHARPHPQDVASVFTQLANSYQVILGETIGVATDANAGQRPPVASNELLSNLVEQLMLNAQHPPEKVDGVPETFLANLERIPKKSLKTTDTCPICSNPFLEDPYPLVVRLPCHKTHLFDFECIEPWLKLNRTCPLDRIYLVPKTQAKKPVGVKEEDGDEEVWDDMYA